MSTQLAQKLRAGTRESHAMAESTGFIKCFLKGVVEPNSYRELVASLYFVYSTMEEELDRLREHPVLSRIYFPELKRRASLEADLDFYYARSWRGAIAPSPATQRYTQRIREIAVAEPELLVAHCYTRYLGDLSGGQILKKMAQRSLELADEGTAFYEFANIADHKAFKETYRRSLDELPLDAAATDAIVAEANLAFALNMAVFEELEEPLIASIGRQRFDAALHRADGPAARHD